MFKIIRQWLCDRMPQFGAYVAQYAIILKFVQSSLETVSVSKTNDSKVGK